MWALLCKRPFFFTVVIWWILSLLGRPGADIQTLQQGELCTSKRTQSWWHSPALCEIPASSQQVYFIIHYKKKSVGKAAAASVWTGEGIKYSFCWGGERRVKERCRLKDEGEHKKRRFDQEGSTTDGDVGFRWASLPERCRPVDSSPPLCLYLWVTWLLRRPGNVCSDSVLNEPPGRDRPSELTPTHFVPVSLSSTGKWRRVLPCKEH